MKTSGQSKLQINNFNMKQFEKKYFDSYSEAEIWMLNTTVDHDGTIRKEPGGQYYIFAGQE